MILNSTRKLQIVLAGAITTNNLPVIVDYEDQSGLSTVRDTFVSSTNGTTAVDICLAPDINTRRKILGIQVYNRDTAAATVQISIVTGATSAQLTDVTLQVDDVLTYTDSTSWRVTDGNGNVKQNTTSSSTLTAATITTLTATAIRPGASGQLLQTQGNVTAKTVSATLTGAELLTGIITVAQGGGAASALQLPLATALDTAVSSAANDYFDFSLINISTVAAETASITTNTGWTLVGNMLLAANTAVTDNSQGRFRARKTGTGAWTLYRIS